MLLDDIPGVVGFIGKGGFWGGEAAKDEARAKTRRGKKKNDLEFI
jgi:hypothetical protein